MSSIRKRGNSFQASVISSEGKRVRKAFKTESEAKSFLKLYDSVSSTVLPTTLGAFTKAIFDRLWGDVKRPEAAQLNINVILRYIDPDLPVPSVTTLVVEDMITRMKADGKSNATINRKLSALSKIMRYAERIDLISKLPEFDYLKEAKGRERVLTHEEEHVVLTFFDHIGLKMDYALVKFLIYTGCRTGEAWKLNRADVSDKFITFIETKNGTTRVIPLTPQARDAWHLACSLNSNDRPFSSLPKDTFRGHWNRLKTHMNLEDDGTFVPHMLRHTCATRLVKAGVDLPRVMKWMGHKNIQTTMRYSHLAPKDLDLAMVALSQGE